MVKNNLQDYINVDGRRSRRSKNKSSNLKPRRRSRSRRGSKSRNRRRSKSRRGSTSSKRRGSKSRNRRRSGSRKGSASRKRRSRSVRRKISKAQKTSRKVKRNNIALDKCRSRGLRSKECKNSLKTVTKMARKNIKDIVKAVGKPQIRTKLAEAKIVIQTQIKMRQQQLVDKLMQTKNIPEPVKDVANAIVKSDLIQGIILDSIQLNQKEDDIAKDVIDSKLAAVKIASSLPPEVVTAINEAPTVDQKADVFLTILTEKPSIANVVKDALRECSCKELVEDIISDFPDKFIDNDSFNKYMEKTKSKFTTVCTISPEIYKACLYNAGFVIGEKPAVLKPSVEFYYPVGQFKEAFDYFIKNGKDVEALMNRTTFPSELKAEKDKIVFLWKEDVASKDLYATLRYFTDFNLDVDGLMKWYSENDKEYNKLLSENQKVVYIFTKEIDETLEDLERAEEYFKNKPKEYYERLKEVYKYSNDYRWIVDTNTISLGEKSDLIKILLYNLDKEHKRSIAISKFKAKFKKNQLEKQSREKILEFGKADSYFRTIVIASLDTPNPNTTLINEEIDKLYKMLFNKYSSELSYAKEDFDKVIQLYKIFKDYTQINRIGDSDLNRTEKYFEDKGVGYLYTTTGPDMYKQLLSVYEKNPIIVAINISSLPFDQKIKYLKYAVYEIDSHTL